MASITEKRICLHKLVKDQQKQNDALKSQLDRLQHLANIGTISHMIAHEINNLLTPLKSYAALATNNIDDKALCEKALKKTVKNCERASGIMESMLALANGQTQEKEETELQSLIDDVFGCLCRDFAKDGITVQKEIPQGLKIWAVPVQIQQVFMNLILNARQVMLPRGGFLSIKAVDKNDTIEIEISDTGDGIKPSDLKYIFDPFFTTKNDKNPSSEHSGAGLGLAFCKRIIEGHDGLISVESERAVGTKFRIILPKPQ
ncbi:MAG: HAMP domain-containing histidine kinase [Sedimentisphaerales bacterium]|nr:HAMP domain-containing histidine kinase [Sedimentisphaerales bacterium]